MKSGRIRTLRGSFTEPVGDLKRQLILDDGRANHGLKVLEFHMWTDSLNNEAFLAASLSLDMIGAGFPYFDAEDNRQIAWVTSGWNYSAPAPVVINPVAIIDPNHVVNESLWIHAFASANTRWNYLIVCEEYTLTDDEAIITLIKERTQNFTP